MSKKVELYRSNSELLNDSIDRIIVEIHTHKKQEGKKSILMTGCGSNSGTTTIAINVAIALAMAGWKTLFVDCDLRKGSTYKRLNEEIDQGLADYLQDRAEKEKIIVETNYEMLNYISSGTSVNSPIRLLCSTNMEKLVGEIESQYDYIVYDFPSINIVSDVNIMLPYMDGIILVAALDETTKRQLSEAKRKIAKYKENYYGLIINQVDMKQYRKYLKDYDYFKQQNLSKRLKKTMKKKQKRER